MPLTNIHSRQSRNVQVKGTPRRKPRKSGGSPIGVSKPPPFATTKMKKTKTCAFRRRMELARNSGRMSSIDAPVVPITEASTAPMAISTALRPGVPARVPRTTIPPAMTKRAPSRTMKATYSLAACATAVGSSVAVQIATGTPSTALRTALLRLDSQSFPAASGRTAMQTSMAAKGTTLQSGRRVPRCGALGVAARRPCTGANLDGAFAAVHSSSSGSRIEIFRCEERIGAMNRARVALLAAAVAACASQKGPTAPPPAQQHGVELSDIDRGANPCTDFFQFANGAWRKANPIPASMQRWSRRWQAGEKNKERLKDILEEISRRSDWPGGSVERIVGDDYASCMDEARAEASGIAPLAPMLAEIDGIR